jgi:hypothetical protein
MCITALTNVTDDSRTMLSERARTTASDNAAGSHHWYVGHIGVLPFTL